MCRTLDDEFSCRRLRPCRKRLHLARFIIHPLHFHDESSDGLTRRGAHHLLINGEAEITSFENARAEEERRTGALLAQIAYMMIAHLKAGTFIARYARTEAERETKRGKPVIRLLHIELHIHMAHLVAFPGLDAGAGYFNHLAHFVVPLLYDDLVQRRHSLICSGKGTALRVALSKSTAATSAAQAGSPVSPLKSQWR